MRKVNTCTDSDSDSDSDSLEFVPESVGKKARRGISWSALQVVARNLITLTCTAFLSRLITPDSFGLIGMVLTLTAFLQIISDLGLSWVTLQNNKLNEHHVSNLFIINTVAGLFVWLVCIFLSSVIADFYSRDELTYVVSIMGATFLINGIAAQPLALLNRKMEYKKVSTIEIVSLVVSSSVAIISAFNGLGYWSLVAQPLTGQLIRAILFYKASNISLFKYKFRIGTSSLLGFGGILTINSLFIYFSRTFDSVLIGKFWGAVELGYYNRAYFLMLLPSTLITGVLANIMIPSLSAFQKDGSRYESAYQRALVMITIIGCPLALGLALVAEEAILLVYGENWLNVVPIFLWLSIASVTQPLYNTTGWIFTSLGKTKEYLLLTIFNAMILGVTFSITVHQGVVALAKSYGIMMGLVLLIPSMWYSHRIAKISFFETLKNIFPILPCLVIMAFSVYYSGSFFVSIGYSWWLTMALKIIIGVFVYTVCCLFLVNKFVKSQMLPLVLKNHE